MLSKRLVAGVAGVAALVMGGAAFAQEACPCGSGTRVGNQAALAALLGNKTVCAAVGNDAWQEFHSGATVAGGPLIDYKLGPGHPVDPTETVGAWSVIGGAGARSGSSVSYRYTGGSTYVYAVCDAGATVNFCSAARNITGARLLAGQVACGPAARSGG